jgi:hypothetical protein
VGGFKITAPIVIDYANIQIEGDLYGAGSTIYPYDCAAFVVDGAGKTGGYCFNVILKDLWINNTNVTTAQDYSVYFSDCYRCKAINVRINNSVVDTATGFTTVFKTGGVQLDNDYSGLFVIGTGNTGSGRLISLEHTSGVPVLTRPDAENAYNGIYIAANVSADIYSPYIERCGNPVILLAGSSPTETPHVNIFGGEIDLPSATTNGITFTGTFSSGEVISIDGVRFTSSDHATKKNALVTSGMTWSNSNKINLANIDWSWITQPSLLNRYADITPYNPYVTASWPRNVYTITKTAIPDNTATAIFTLSDFAAGAVYNPIFVKIKAFATHNGYDVAFEDSVYSFVQRNASDLNITTKQISASNIYYAGTANFAITTFEMSYDASAFTSVVFNLTSDFNNAVVTTLAEVYFTVEVIGPALFTAN